LFLNIKKSLALLIIIFLLLWDISVYAVSSKWVVLRSFKKYEYRLLFESDKPFLGEKAREIFDSSRKYELYKNIREKVQEKREFLQKENIKVTNKISNLSDSVKTLNKEIEEAQIAKTVQELKTTIVGINSVIANLEKGEGSLGKLLKDEKMYTNLMNASKELEELLREMKEHPKRFVHFSLFGKKDKTGYVEPKE